jgi:hypothetical protein
VSATLRGIRPRGNQKVFDECDLVIGLQRRRGSAAFDLHRFDLALRRGDPAPFHILMDMNFRLQQGEMESNRFA